MDRFVPPVKKKKKKRKEGRRIVRIGEIRQRCVPDFGKSMCHATDADHVFPRDLLVKTLVLVCKPHFLLKSCLVCKRCTDSSTNGWKL